MLKEPYKTVAQVSNCLQCDKSGVCGVFASWATRVLLKKGFTRFHVVFGWICDETGLSHDHIWLELDSGEEIDPTIVQFTQPIRRLNKRKNINPETFLRKKGFQLNDPRTIPWYKGFLRKSLTVPRGLLTKG